LYLAENDHISDSEKRRGPYHIPKRELMKREIRRLVVEKGLTNKQLCETLNISDRTARRYLAQIFKEDNELLLRPSVDELATQANIFKEQLAMQRQQVLDGIANNENADFDTRIAAHDLAANMGWAIMKLNYETPAAIARHVKLDGTNLGYQQKGLNLVLRH
jgi:transcriptional regulator with XRE-family HTH domain